MTFQSKCSAATGIPEPGLVMYGSVSNTATGLPLFTNTVVWQVTGGGPSETVIVNNATIAWVNGQFYYVARVPFETRSLGGVIFQKTPNTLSLNSSGTSYTRTASVGTNNATLVYSSLGTLSTFTFDATKRGVMERLDLRVTMPGDLSQDTDHDGVPDWAELRAGTNPADPNSVFKASSDIRPAVGGGLVIHWSSVEGKAYSILRTIDITKPFTALATGIAATAPDNEYTDSTATGVGPYFYRISVQ